MANDRELKLKMTIVPPDPSKPSQALQDIANQANRTSKALQDMNRQAERSKQVFGGGSALAAPNLTGGGSAIFGAGGGGYRPGSAIHHPQNPWGQSNINFHTGAGAGPQRMPGMPGAPGAGGGAGGGMGAMGAMGAMGSLGMIGAAVAAVAAAASAFGTVTDAAAKLSDPLATSADRLQTFARAVPVFGDGIASIVTSITTGAARLADWSGSIERDRKIADHPFEMAKMGIRAAGADRLEGIGLRRRDAMQQLDAFNAVPSLALQNAQRTGLTGAIGRAAYMGQDPRLRDSREAVRTAERDLAAASAGQQSAGFDLAGVSRSAATAEADLARATAKRIAAEKAAGVGAGVGQGGFNTKVAVGSFFAGSGPLAAVYGGYGGFGGMGKAAEQSIATQPLIAARQEEAQALTVQIREQEKLLAAQERLGQRSVDTAQKRLELERKRTDVLKTQSDLQMQTLREESARTQSATAAFASLDIVEQRWALDAATRLKEGGRNAVGPHELAMLQRLDGRFAQETLVDQAKDSPMMADWLKTIGATDKKIIDQAIEKQQKIQSKLEAEIVINTDNIKKVLEERIKALPMEMNGIVMKIIKAEIQKIEIQRHAGGLAANP